MKGMPYWETSNLFWKKFTPTSNARASNWFMLFLAVNSKDEQTNGPIIAPNSSFVMEYL